MEISCETNDPNATVTLTIRDRHNELKTSRHFSSRLRQIGQTFFIDNLRVPDSGEVFCNASKGNFTNQSMYKGKLIVNAGKFHG